MARLSRTRLLARHARHGVSADRRAALPGTGVDHWTVDRDDDRFVVNADYVTTNPAVLFGIA